MMRAPAPPAIAFIILNPDGILTSHWDGLCRLASGTTAREEPLRWVCSTGRSRS